jgi:hypothetical protein
VVDSHLVCCSPRKGSRPVAGEEVDKAVDGDGGLLVLENQPDLERIAEVVAERGIEIAVPNARCSRA